MKCYDLTVWCGPTKSGYIMLESYLIPSVLKATGNLLIISLPNSFLHDGRFQPTQLVCTSLRNEVLTGPDPVSGNISLIFSYQPTQRRRIDLFTLIQPPRDLPFPATMYCHQRSQPGSSHPHLQFSFLKISSPYAPLVFNSTVIQVIGKVDTPPAAACRFRSKPKT